MFRISRGEAYHFQRNLVSSSGPSVRLYGDGKLYRVVMTKMVARLGGSIATMTPLLADSLTFCWAFIAVGTPLAPRRWQAHKAAGQRGWGLGMGRGDGDRMG